MNIAFDAGAIEIAKGSGIGNYTLHQFEKLLRLYPEHNFHYFNMVEDSSLTNRFSLFPNFHKHYFNAGKDNILRHYRGEYQDIFGSLLRHFIIKNHIDTFYIAAPFLTSTDIGYNILYKQEWFNGICVVVTVYDVIPYILQKWYLPSKESLNWYMSCIAMIKWTDRQLVISNSVKEDLVKHFHFRPEKIDVIYGGASEKYKALVVSQNEKDAIYHKWQIHPDQEFFLCAVSADQRKNTDGIIRAYALLPDDLRAKHPMVVAGRLADRKKHEDQIKRLGMEKQIILTDYIQNDDELIKLYNLSKFVVIPSLYEGFGLPVVEAWACGKAVLASNNAGLGELVKEAGISFNPHSTVDMANCLKQALTTADLSDLARLGHDKLPFYQWENVARLSMESINKASLEHKNLRPDGRDKKKHIACIFVRKEYYTDGWKIFLEKLKDTYLTDVYLEDFPQSRYDQVVYFVSERRLHMLNNIDRYPRGTWIILDASMSKLLEMITGVNEDDGQGAIISEYLESVRQEGSKFICDKIIVADAQRKNTLLSDPSLLGRVYAISPVVAYYANTPLAIKEKIGSTAFQNFLSALSDESIIQEPTRLLDNLKVGEIQFKAYTTNETKALSTSIGFALSTEGVCKTVSLRALKFDELDTKPLKVAMVSSWGTKCGIAEYTKYFIENVSSEIDFQVWPNKVNEVVIDDEMTAPRLWEHKGDTRELISGLMNAEPDIVHIQYTEGFFTVQGLTDIIGSMCNTAKIIVSCHNTKFLYAENKQQLETLNKAYFTVHQESDIKRLCANDIEGSRISLIPLGQVAAPDREKDMVKHVLKLDGYYPIIGSFGFIFRHKCISEIIEAVAILKKRYPNILFISCNALYNVDASKTYYDDCLSLIGNLSLENHVKMVPDFMVPEEALHLLQACDLFVLPYASTLESASGAVRFCVGARRPLVLTDQPIFADMKDYALYIKNEHSNTIAEGINQLLEETMYAQKLRAVNLAIEKNTWSYIEKLYVNLYGLEMNADPQKASIVLDQHKR